jgi:hypothetical protein
MNRSTLTLAALGLLLALSTGFSAAQGGKPPQVPQAVEQRYTKLQQEFSAAVAKYQKAAEEAREAKSKLAAERPHKQFAARYADLAREGHPRAARWCIDFIADTSSLESERRELYLACEALLVPHVLWTEESQLRHVTPVQQDYGVAQLLRSLRSAGPVVGKEKALALCQELFDKSEVPESRAGALDTQAAILLADLAHGAPPPPEVLELYRRLVKEFPETSSGKRASGQLFRIEHLQIGMSAPDFATQDVEGVAFKLSDYRGKVVVLDFWGFW